jgi:hypothetical protein
LPRKRPSSDATVRALCQVPPDPRLSRLSSFSAINNPFSFTLQLGAAELAGVSPYCECNAALRSADRFKSKPYIRFIWFLMNALAKCDRYVGTNVLRREGRPVRRVHEEPRGVGFQISSCTSLSVCLSCSLVAVLALYTAELAGVSPFCACIAALRSADRFKSKPYIRFIWFLMNALAKCDRYDGANVFRGVKANLSAEYPRNRVVSRFRSAAARACSLVAVLALYTL